MGILKDQLPESNLGLKGRTPAQRPGANQASTLHYESSINNRPAINQKPSDLDLDGTRPTAYMDNPPA